MGSSYGEGGGDRGRDVSCFLIVCFLFKFLSVGR